MLSFQQMRIETQPKRYYIRNLTSKSTSCSFLVRQKSLFDLSIYEFSRILQFHILLVIIDLHK